MGFSEGPILLHISNKIGNYVCGTLHNVHDGKDDIIYAPSWMLHALDVTENLSIASVPRHVCKKISLRPHNSGLLAIDEWHLKFASSIRSYNTLTIGTRIPIVMDNKYMFMSIISLNDSKHSTYYLVNGEEISIEMLQPIESILPETLHTRSYLYRDPRKINDTPRDPFTGGSHVLGGTQDGRPVRELVAEAALKRHQKLKEETHIVGTAEIVL
jgi:hypothetical protein